MGFQDLDLRVNAIRDDLADKSLADFTNGQLLVEPDQGMVIGEVVPVRSRPDHKASLDTQALFGEQIKVFDQRDGWAWMQLEKDGYVGYIPANCLSLEPSTPGHKVRTLSTFVYPEPNIKIPPALTLPMNAQVEVVAVSGKFSEIQGGGFIYSSHLTDISDLPKDFIAIAEMYKGTPYLWGGKSGSGIDCSGLVQMSILATGVNVPRDSDMQEKQLGTIIGDNINTCELIKGDLVFWKGHVGIMITPETLLHANGHHMLTVAEPVKEAVDRIAGMYGHVTSVKRL